MSKSISFRFFVEDDGGRRSTTWNVSVSGNDIYVTPGLMAKSSKVSLHKSGSYQWSLRAEHVPHAPFVPASGRHIAKWKRPDVQAGDFTHEFFVLVPASELRVDHPPPPPTKRATKVVAPSIGQAVLVDIFASRLPYPINASLVSLEPLFSTQVRDGRLLVLWQRSIPLDEATQDRLLAAKSVALEKQQAAGVSSSFAVARITNPNGVSGMIEFAPAAE